MYPSEIRRLKGLDIKHEFALIRCRCRNFTIVSRGERTKLCPYCGRRFWLSEVKPYGSRELPRMIFESDSLEFLQNLKGGMGNYYHPTLSRSSVIPRQRFIAGNLSAGARRGVAGDGGTEGY